jgi:carboxypeptidase Q
MQKLIWLLFCLLWHLNVLSQTHTEDSLRLRAIYSEALINGHAYDNLRYLCKDIGPRLSGSQNANKAISWSFELLKSYGFDNVWLQEIQVPHWERGTVEKCEVISSERTPIPLAITSLGGSIGTQGVLRAPVIEFSSLDELKAADPATVKGHIVFINQPMNQSYIQTFKAYGSCASIRVHGAAEAAEKGAIAVLNRSLATNHDDHPHTGVMVYRDTIPKIPAAAIGITSANLLHELIENQNVNLSIEMNCYSKPDTTSFNVIAEITGSEKPNEYMVVGGHLDSWDIGEGAHDDGAGVVQSIEVIRLFKELNIRPKRTLRCILYMNEENGNRGGKGYAKRAIDENERHFLAMESDRGGFTPRGFTIDGTKEQQEAIQAFAPLFEPYYSNLLIKGYGGVNINPLRPTGPVLIGLLPDSQRYFDLHHSENDVFEEVNRRELLLGAAGMASLIYLIDKYGLPKEVKP